MITSDLSIEGRARLDILRAALNAGKKGAHIAPSLSDVDICIAILQIFDDKNDSYILSKGHGALGYYAAMHQMGIMSDEQFASFEANGGKYPGQPSRNADNHIEYSSGSLGMGLPYGVGIALAKKESKGKVYIIVGDGELNEGSNWEAAALAGRYELDNLVVIVDSNGLQSDGNCCDIMGQDLTAMWKASGWHVEKCDGHIVSSIQGAISRCHSGRPLAIIAETVKGKGISFMENNNAWHHSVLKEEDYNNAVQEIITAYGLQ